MWSVALALAVAGIGLSMIANPSANDSRPDDSICHQQLVACFQEWNAAINHLRVDLEEILDVALECKFERLAVSLCAAETDPVLRRHLTLKVFNHALSCDRVVQAENLIQELPNPDTGRAEIAAGHAMRGRFRKSVEMIGQIKAPGIRTAEWFRLATLTANSDSVASKFAAEQGWESLKLLEHIHEAENTNALVQCVFAEVMRSPNPSPLAVANRVLGKRFEGVKSTVYEDLLNEFAEHHEKHLYVRFFNELLIRDRLGEQARLHPFSDLTPSVRDRLSGLGASLVHCEVDVEKVLPEILAQLRLGRSLAERVSELTPDELSLHLSAALDATGTDKTVSDGVYFDAINALSERGQFSSAFLLLPHLHKPHASLLRVASCAFRNGHPDEALDAVRQWKDSSPTLNEDVFEDSLHQELVPVLVHFCEKSLLERMVSASTPSNQILLQAHEASQKGELLDMYEAASKLHSLISFAEALGGIGRRESAEQIFVAVAEELERIPRMDLKRSVAARLAESTIATLGTVATTAMVHPGLEQTARRALVERICFSYGAMKETGSAEEFLTSIASPVESMFGRLSFVRGLLNAELFNGSMGVRQE